MPEFLDKVKQGIARSVTTASVKSKELLDVAKLRNQISALEKVKRESIEELGRIAYAMHINGNIDVNAINNKGYSICRIDEQIQTLEDDIVRVQTESRQLLNENDGPGNCACGAPVPNRAYPPLCLGSERNTGLLVSRTVGSSLMAVASSCANAHSTISGPTGVPDRTV